MNTSYLSITLAGAGTGAGTGADTGVATCSEATAASTKTECISNVIALSKEMFYIKKQTELKLAKLIYHCPFKAIVRL